MILFASSSEVSRLQAALEGAETASCATSGRVSELEAELQALRVESESEVAKIHKENADVTATLESDLATARDRVAMLEREAEGTADELKQTASSYFEKSTECSSLEQQLNSAKEDLAKSAESISRLEGDVAALSSELSASLERVSHLTRYDMM